MKKVFTLDELGLKVQFDKYARQASGAAWIEHGNNIVLSTVVASKDEKDFMGFFPLTVEYREKTSAAGKIPGGYIKREGRLSDTEILTSRLIDRPIRPLFPKYFFSEVQVISAVYSYDGKFPPGVLSIIGSSLALVLSPIPFLGPVGAVQIGKVDGKWVFNAPVDVMAKSSVDLIVAGTVDGISMVEGNSNSMSEDELVEVLLLSHDHIKKQVEWQLSIKKELGIEDAEDTEGDFWSAWEAKVQKVFTIDSCEPMFADSKEERNLVLRRLRDEVLGHFAGDIESGAVSKAQLEFIFESLLKEYLPDLIAKKGKRIDDRPFDKVRDITTEVSILPCVHGSSMFRRGETQALASLTLGTSQDAQKVDDLNGVKERTFMLHYNFPPFATGEAKPIRGVGRREIGHGYLAEKSFEYVLPNQEDFPYTIRSLVDVLESNGSSSMATLCATTMALMDAGVPIKSMVSGIAMGLMKDSSGNFHVLSDILGLEDAFGLMDFKITGTADGIMAVQMDVKAKAGVTRDVLKRALEQARIGRLHILGEMKKVMAGPREKISELAPRVFSFKVDPSKIGVIIGPGGKTIKEIIAETGTQIDISDDGTVKIYSQESSSARKAEQWVKTLAGEISVGSVFEGKIRRIAEFGLFVELVPGKDGLVHISSISRDKQRTLMDDYRIDDVLKVKVVAVEQETGRVRLVAPELS